MRSRAAFIIFCIGLFLSGTGCGRRTATVSGTVKLDGKPLVLGTVNLMSADEVPYQGQIQSDGQYTIEGVPLGTYGVMVFSPEPAAVTAPSKKKKTTPQIEKMLKDRQALRDKWFAIPEKYSQFDQSGLSLEVDESPKVFDIDLKK